MQEEEEKLKNEERKKKGVYVCADPENKGVKSRENKITKRKKSKKSEETKTQPDIIDTRQVPDVRVPDYFKLVSGSKISYPTNRVPDPNYQNSTIPNPRPPLPSSLTGQ